MTKSNNMKKEMTELEKKIYNDIQLKIWEFFDCNDIKYKHKDCPEETIEDFFAFLYKLISPSKRKVHFSKELTKKIELNKISMEHVNILKKYADAFSEGEDMNAFLSNNIKEPRETDFLLYTWHLYHLHMSDKFVDEKSQMKNNRSNTQLLCIVNPSDVYFIDVIPHPTTADEYFNISSLEIVVNNGWMDKIGFHEMKGVIPGTLKPKITENKDIFKLYSKASVNIIFEFQEKAYGSVEPMSLNRKPHAAMTELIKINREIHNLNKVEGKYKEFQLACNGKGVLLGIILFESQTGEEIYFNIF